MTLQEHVLDMGARGRWPAHRLHTCAPPAAASNASICALRGAGCTLPAVFASIRNKSNNECRIAALVPLVEEAHGIYDFLVNMLRAMHARTRRVGAVQRSLVHPPMADRRHGAESRWRAAEVDDIGALSDLRERFNEQYVRLYNFFQEAAALRYLTSLIAVPKLDPVRCRGGAAPSHSFRCANPDGNTGRLCALQTPPMLYDATRGPTMPLRRLPPRPEPAPAPQPAPQPAIDPALIQELNMLREQMQQARAYIAELMRVRPRRLAGEDDVLRPRS